jgi:hypothetical protein
MHRHVVGVLPWDTTEEAVGKQEGILGEGVIFKQLFGVLSHIHLQHCIAGSSSSSSTATATLSSSAAAD